VTEVTEVAINPNVVEFDTPVAVEFLTKSGAEYTITGVVSMERGEDGGMVFTKTDQSFTVLEHGFEFFDVRFT